MCKLHTKLFFVVFLALALCSQQTMAMVKGIYITQSTLENTALITYLIQRSKTAGIDTFIVDVDTTPNKKYQTNIALLKANNITYVARVEMFPGGGTPEQINSESYREQRYALAKRAVDLGAAQIQLDYIRYKASQPASPENAQHVLKIIAWFKERLAKQNIPLQVDVFGIASFGESKHIGQNIKLFSQSVDVVCPMVYPSHYEPYKIHAVTPYKTVRESLEAIKAQFYDATDKTDKMTMKLNPYIELSNYRYPLSHDKKLEYIYAQIQAAQDAGADGWYAWSAHNKYDNLFAVLETHQVK